jgi:hypothetical protein
MLRLKRGLRPRVSNLLAAVSALALLLASLMHTGDSEPAHGTSSELSDAKAFEAVEPAQDPVPAVQTTVPGGKKISLMIFH